MVAPTNISPKTSEASRSMEALLKLRVWSLCEYKCYLSSAKLTTTGETLRIMRQSHNCGKPSQRTCPAW